MTPAPKPTELAHVPVRLRVTVDKRLWDAEGDLAEDVRKYVVKELNASPLLVSVRRDSL
jgi:hypothetical protein